MYYTRNRSKPSSNEIKGPSSALTQFLKEQGINANKIKERWKHRNTIPKTKDCSKVHLSSKVISKSIKEEVTDSDVIIQNNKIKGHKEVKFLNAERPRTLNQESDEDEKEYEGNDNLIDSLPRSQCNKRIILNKKCKLEGNRRKKRAITLDAKFNHFPTLQELCITILSENIVKFNQEASNKYIRELLGDLSTENMNKLAQTLSKNRVLNDTTFQLFLKKDLTKLVFYDCSKLSWHSYNKLPSFTPHLTKINLQMCGQLNNNALLDMGRKLLNLKEIRLDGPFLINKDTWNQFFEIMKDRLTTFHISNTHRFDDSCLDSLLQNSGRILTSLKLSRIDNLTNYSLLSQYLSNKNFDTLCIEYPRKEEYVNDDIIINLLKSLGLNLKILNLNGCTGLTDMMIINGMAKYLGNENILGKLESLELEELDQITNEGLVHFFQSIQLKKLKQCNLKRCLKVGDETIIKMLCNEAKNSITMLNLNSLKSLTKNSLQIMNCPQLKYLNVGFVRCVDNELVNDIINQNPMLEVIEVYGDNLVTNDVISRHGVTIIGRETDII